MHSDQGVRRIIPMIIISNTIDTMTFCTNDLIISWSILISFLCMTALQNDKWEEYKSIEREKARCILF